MLIVKGNAFLGHTNNKSGLLCLKQKPSGPRYLLQWKSKARKLRCCIKTSTKFYQVSTDQLFSLRSKCLTFDSIKDLVVLKYLILQIN